MTKEELKEAIAATITENGQKGITGQALANLLNEIVDAAGEGGGNTGGSGNVFLVNMESASADEKNAKVRQGILDVINTGEMPLVVLCAGGEIEPSFYMLRSQIPAITMFRDGALLFEVIDPLSGSNEWYLLNEDGSVEVTPV